MKILITEKQLNYLKTKNVFEQSLFGDQFLNKTHGDPEKAQKYNKEQKEFFNSHEGKLVLGIATAFIPVVGPLLSAGIGVMDAKQYKQEGDTRTAGLVALFSFLPLVGSLKSYLPGITKLGKDGMAKLASKIMSNNRNLSQVETEVMDWVLKNPKIVEKSVETEVKALAAAKATTVTNKTLSTQLASIAKSGLQAGKTIGKEVAKAVAISGAYDQAYDVVQSNTPRVKAEKEGLDWNLVKSAFASSGSADDNKKLMAAWDKGWRPGNVVPAEFQTDVYKKEYEEEQRNLDKLNSMLASLDQ